MSVDREFETIDLIVNSQFETRGVDAFALAVIKADRQLRKLFTHIVFQFPCFGSSDIRFLRETLGNNKGIYFKETEACINALIFCTVKDLVGAMYDEFRPRIEEAIEYRNKIFHGQLTQKYLSRDDLFELVRDIRGWCNALSDGALAHIGYDGFDRDSFRKSCKQDFSNKLRVQFGDVEAYADFLKQHMR